MQGRKPFCMRTKSATLPNIKFIINIKHNLIDKKKINCIQIVYPRIRIFILRNYCLTTNTSWTTNLIV